MDYLLHHITMLQIIFKNFPYKKNNNRHGVHVWNYNSNVKPLLWCDVRDYIKENTNVPMHFLEIRDPKNGLSSKIILNTADNTPVNIDNFKSTYKTKSLCSHIDVWFDIHLNVFGKPILRE